MTIRINVWMFPKGKAIALFQLVVPTRMLKITNLNHVSKPKIQTFLKVSGTFQDILVEGNLACCQRGWMRFCLEREFTEGEKKGSSFLSY